VGGAGGGGGGDHAAPGGAARAELRVRAHAFTAANPRCSLTQHTRAAIPCRPRASQAQGGHLQTGGWGGEGGEG